MMLTYLIIFKVDDYYIFFHFYKRGIESLQNRWPKIASNDGGYVIN